MTGSLSALATPEAMLHRCALLMLSAAQEFDALSDRAEGDALAARMAEVSGALLGLKHDLIHDLSELEGDESDASKSARARCLRRLTNWVHEDLASWRDLGLAMCEGPLSSNPEAQRLAQLYAAVHELVVAVDAQLKMPS